MYNVWFAKFNVSQIEKINLKKKEKERERTLSFFLPSCEEVSAIILIETKKLYKLFVEGFVVRTRYH